MRNYSIPKYILILQFLALNIFGQLSTNFESINSLVAESIDSIRSVNGEFPSKIGLEYVSPPDYMIFRNTVVKSLSDAGSEVHRNGGSYDGDFLAYTLNQVKLTYEETFKSGLFGGYYTVRRVEVAGSYTIGREGPGYIAESFSISRKDTVDYDLVPGLENPSYPFTSSELPPEPFFSGLWEPLIALGAAVVTVILFFSVRSK